MTLSERLQQLVNEVEQAKETLFNTYKGKDFDARGEMEASIVDLSCKHADLEKEILNEEHNLNHREEIQYDIIRKDAKTNADAERKTKLALAKDTLEIKVRKTTIRSIEKKLESFERLLKYLDRYHFRDNAGMERMT